MSMLLVLLPLLGAIAIFARTCMLEG